MTDPSKILSTRLAGVLLHPTSLSSDFGIGDLGEGADRWIEWMKRAGLSVWQVLPLGPTGYGDSPYQSFSSFAGNPMLISPGQLLEQGLLEPEDVDPLRSLPKTKVDFGELIRAKSTLLIQAHTKYMDNPDPDLARNMAEFRNANRDWIEDYALFMSLKKSHNGRPWSDWPSELALRESDFIENTKKDLAESIERIIFYQFLFYDQWSRLKERARSSGIALVGDIPIFVAHDSVDVWANRDLFILDELGDPEVVAGVPPDYFSATGQRWGNPLYRWERHAQDGFSWWIRRLQQMLQMVDVVRLDHFRGFEAYWEIPADHPTAEHGRWIKGPGASFFESIQAALGDLPLIAEDLGVITPEVSALRERFALPGMAILQFAFSGDPQNSFLPDKLREDSVVYTGTHDNDTTLGWFINAPESEKSFYRAYTESSGEDISWELLSLAWNSTPRWAVAPLQDFLELGSEARMNYPSKAEGNWGWRVLREQLTNELAEKIRTLTSGSGRLPSFPN